jgi:two-component system sensor kinase FixL
LSLKNPDLEEVRAALDDVAVDSQRAQKVVERIRNLVRNKEPEFIDVDLNRVAGDALEVLYADARARGIALHLDLEPDLPLVKGDSVQLQQVVLNLTLNAFEAMGNDQADGRLLTVKTARGGDGTVSLSVSDTGRGVGDQATGRIFEPFFTTKPQGLGLGLAIGRTIAEAHGGTLEAVTNSDKGATFRLRLPFPAGGMRFAPQGA